MRTDFIADRRFPIADWDGHARFFETQRRLRLTHSLHRSAVVDAGAGAIHDLLPNRARRLSHQLLLPQCRFSLRTPRENAPCMQRDNLPRWQCQSGPFGSPRSFPTHLPASHRRLSRFATPNVSFGPLIRQASSLRWPIGNRQSAIENPQSVCTSTESTAGKSCTIGNQESPESADA